MKFYFLLILTAFSVLACSQGENTKTSTGVAIQPTVTLSRERIPESGWLIMVGKGFTPKQAVQSHLRRPDGTEFREVTILTDDKGAFEHDIDSLLLLKGVHDVWAVDTATGQSSNVAHFTTTNEPGPTQKPNYPTF